MTPQQLAMDLADYLREVHKNFRGSDPKISDKPMRVVPGYLPERVKQHDASFPHIAVRVNNVKDLQDGSTASVHIIIGTYCVDNEDGWLEIVNLAERTRQELLRNRVIAKKYRLDMRQGLTTDIPSEQPRPIWVAVLSATYTIKQVEEELIY